MFQLLSLLTYHFTSAVYSQLMIDQLKTTDHLLFKVTKLGVFVLMSRHLQLYFICYSFFILTQTMIFLSSHDMIATLKHKDSMYET